ncbi:MAG: ATP-binding protein, partial [Alphaproteobacteria bacterium]|nr:ATP-binding protein [Alphaproteobacteria bacterium]
MAPIKPLSIGDLYAGCDTKQFDFRTTGNLPNIEELIGQERAVEAVCFGIAIESDGYNVFALGPPGIGKNTLVGEFLARQAEDEAVPSDWCYVHNFDHPRRPTALELPAGRARPLARDMDTLIQDLRAAIPAAFESDAYRERKEAIEQDYKERQEQASEELQKRAGENNIALVRTPVGLGLAPVKDGKVIDPEVFEKLPEKERRSYAGAIEALQQELQASLDQVPKWAREMRERVHELNRDVAKFAVEHYLEDFKKAYADLPNVLQWLESVAADLIENADAFIAASGEGAAMQLAIQGIVDGPSFRQYRVNVLIDRTEVGGAPVVYEDNPTVGELIGRIEHQAQQGALVTDFNLIKAGALHAANGGYLVVEAHKVLTQPLSWEALKRALRAREIRIQSLGQSLGLVDTVSLDPEPVPLDVKIVLTGDRTLYYLLAAYDPDFLELFKVQADFEETMERTPENVQRYAQLVGTIAQREDLRPLDRGAVARIVEHGARLAGDKHKLTTHMRSIADLVRESAHWAGEASHRAIKAEDVQRAIDASIYRADRVRERVQESIHEGTILIQTSGEAVGQVNGLSVLQLGGYAFGRPSRITARIQLGRGRVVDIEREVELGGPLHTKGVLILSGFLGARFGADRPLALSASLVFEQSYGGVDGDSASSAELYALLSAIGEVPIKQSLAVTGSVNQHGIVQAIGGANEKIEGYFDICRAGGLDGSHGVLIPASNVRHLMLRGDVVEAVKRNQFN